MYIEYISECSKSHYCHKVLRGNCYYFRNSWENHKNEGTFDVAEYRMYICAEAQGKENSMEQRRISFLTVEWAKMDGWSSMQESAGIDMYVCIWCRSAWWLPRVFNMNKPATSPEKKRGKATFFINLWHTFPHTWTAVSLKLPYIEYRVFWRCKFSKKNVIIVFKTISKLKVKVRKDILNFQYVKATINWVHIYAYLITGHKIYRNAHSRNWSIFKIL